MCTSVCDCRHVTVTKHAAHALDGLRKRGFSLGVTTHPIIESSRDCGRSWPTAGYFQTRSSRLFLGILRKEYSVRAFRAELRPTPRCSDSLRSEAHVAARRGRYERQGLSNPFQKRVGPKVTASTRSATRWRAPTVYLRARQWKCLPNSWNEAHSPNHRLSIQVYRPRRRHRQRLLACPRI
jgi:hypothetical protein